MIVFQSHQLTTKKGGCMSAQSVERVPLKGWITTFAGTTINLCLGILYAWSIWKKALVDVDKAGEVMTGVNAGWTANRNHIEWLMEKKLVYVGVRGSFRILA